MITVRNLSKSYFVHKKQAGFWGSVRSLFSRKQIERQAVRGVSLDVAPGEILGLVGPNGAGKTTLLKMLAGIIHPTAGQVSVMGHVPWERHNDFRRQIALIMGQKAQLWWDLPAEDCFLLLKEIYQIPDERYTENLDALAGMLNAKEYLDVQVRRLSLGERMKMELIAALLHEPKVVFLDEPTIGLDLAAQRAIRDFLLTYRRRHNPAMILTSHYMEDIEQLCDRVAIIQDGKFVFHGALTDIKRTCANQKVITAHLRGMQAPVVPTATELASFGDVRDLDGTLVRLCVAQERVADAAAWLLRHLDVADLSIEEEDIGTTIEGILREHREIVR